MSTSIDDVESLPHFERVYWLEETVVKEFKSALLMPDDEDLPLDTAFFEMGMSSLTLTDIKSKLEDHLGCVIDGTVLFNCPTVESLLDRLKGNELRHLFE